MSLSQRGVANRPVSSPRLDLDEFLFGPASLAVTVAAVHARADHGPNVLRLPDDLIARSA